MSINYYLQERPPCECCNRPYERLHIGKSSGGWCFALHVIPNRGIFDLEDWKIIWSQHGGVITDEYGEVVSKEEMLKIITERHMDSPPDWSEEELKRNYAKLGPNNLLRAMPTTLDHCSSVKKVVSGSGTWDCVEGNFS